MKPLIYTPSNWDLNPVVDSPHMFYREVLEIGKNGLVVCEFHHTEHLNFFAEWTIETVEPIITNEHLLIVKYVRDQIIVEN